MATSEGAHNCSRENRRCNSFQENSAVFAMASENNCSIAPDSGGRAEGHPKSKMWITRYVADPAPQKRCIDFQGIGVCIGFEREFAYAFKGFPEPMQRCAGIRDIYEKEAGAQTARGWRPSIVAGRRFARFGVVGAELRQGVLDMAREHVLRRALLVEGDFGRHRPVGLASSHGRDHRLQRGAGRVLDRRRFIAAMDHAVGALLVIAGAVAVPVRFVHQLAEGLHIAFAEHIAGTLPAEIVALRVAPRPPEFLLLAAHTLSDLRPLAERPLPA